MLKRNSSCLPDRCLYCTFALIFLTPFQGIHSEIVKSVQAKGLDDFRIAAADAADLPTGLGAFWNIRKAKEKSKFLTVCLALYL